MKYTGSKYQTRTDIKDIAKKIRTEIKTILSKEVPDLKVSVKIERYSMGQSINVFIKKVGFNPLNPKWTNSFDNEEPILSPLGKSVKDAIERIMKQYNQVDSDPQTDYYCADFSLYVTYDSEFIVDCRNRLGISIF